MATAGPGGHLVIEPMIEPTERDLKSARLKNNLNKNDPSIKNKAVRQMRKEYKGFDE